MERLLGQGKGQGRGQGRGKGREQSGGRAGVGGKALCRVQGAWCMVQGVECSAVHFVVNPSAAEEKDPVAVSGGGVPFPFDWRCALRSGTRPNARSNVEDMH